MNEVCRQSLNRKRLVNSASETKMTFTTSISTVRNAALLLSAGTGTIAFAVHSPSAAIELTTRVATGALVGFALGLGISADLRSQNHCHADGSDNVNTDIVKFLEDCVLPPILGGGLGAMAGAGWFVVSHIYASLT